MERWTGSMPSWRRAITLLGTQTCSKRVDSMRAGWCSRSMGSCEGRQNNYTSHQTYDTGTHSNVISIHADSEAAPHHWHDSALTRDSHPFNAVMSR